MTNIRRGRLRGYYVGPSHEQLQARAFASWERRGRPEGSPHIDWIIAKAGQSDFWHLTTRGWASRHDVMHKGERALYSWKTLESKGYPGHSARLCLTLDGTRQDHWVCIVDQLWVLLCEIKNSECGRQITKEESEPLRDEAMKITMMQYPADWTKSPLFPA